MDNQQYLKDPNLILKRKAIDIHERLSVWINLIKDEVTELVIRNYVFNDFLQSCQKDTKITSTTNIFFDTLKYNHFNSQIISINRLIEDDQKVISMIRLLNFLFRNPDIYTYTKYADLQRKFRPNFVDIEINKSMIAEYHELYGNSSLDTTKLQSDINKIISIKDVFNKPRNIKIAHLERNLKYHFEIKQSELSNAIDDLEFITCKYYQLITGSYFTDWKLMPSITYDWRKIYTEIANIY